MSAALDATSAVLTRILVPAVEGRPIEIGAPIGVREVERELEASSSADVMIHGLLRERTQRALLARVRAYAALDLEEERPCIDAWTARAGVLLHDLFSAFHPEIYRSIARPTASEALVRGAGVAVDTLEPPRTLRDALLRHAWLGAILERRCVREDLSWWTGAARFVGQPSPPRLSAMPGLRRVRRVVRSVALLELPAAYDEARGASAYAQFASVVARLLARSPLTDLSLAGRATPAFCWTRALAQLADSPAGVNVMRRMIQALPAPTREAVGRARLASKVG